MKKSFISFFAVVVVLSSMATQAFAYMNPDSLTDLSEVDMTTISFSQDSWRYYDAIYLDAKEKGDADTMKKAQAEMNEAHMIAVATRATYGNYLEGVDASVYLTKLSPYDSNRRVYYVSVITAIYQYDAAYNDFKEGTISYEQMKLIQADALKIIEDIKAQYEKQ